MPAFSAVAISPSILCHQWGRAASDAANRRIAQRESRRSRVSSDRRERRNLSSSPSPPTRSSSPVLLSLAASSRLARAAATLAVGSAWQATLHVRSSCRLVSRPVRVVFNPHTVSTSPSFCSFCFSCRAVPAQACAACAIHFAACDRLCERQRQRQRATLSGQAAQRRFYGGAYATEAIAAAAGNRWPCSRTAAPALVRARRVARR